MADASAPNSIDSSSHADASLGAEPTDQDGRSEQRRVIADAWLNWQCKMVAGVQRGVVFSTSNGQLNMMLSHWPANEQRPNALGVFAAEAHESGEVLIQGKQDSEDSSTLLFDQIAIPIVNDGGEFVVVMQIAARSQSQQEAVVQLVQWGGMWLGSLDSVVSGISGCGTNVSVQLAEQVLAHDDLYAACLEASNRLATELQCQRVSVGLTQGLSVKLKAISQVSDFDGRHALVRAIESAMEEAVSQKATVNLANVSDDNLLLTRAHEELRQAHGSMVSCTVPLYSNDEVVGAVLLERDSEKGFPTEVVSHANAALAPLGPVLQLIKKEQRSVPVRARDWTKKKVSRKSLPETAKGKAVAGVGCVALLAGLLFPVTHNVSATARIEGADKQALVAPHAGYIKSAVARAGDHVKAGQVIASLEVRELSIERDKWIGERGKIKTSLTQALSGRDRSELGMLQAKKTQVDAELALIEQKLSRSEIAAPFDGVLVSGDLNQSLGAPVEIGQVLFEVASMESYRLVLEIDEHDVAGIKSDQPGVLRFSALPSDKHGITTSNIMPVALTKDRKSVFSVEAKLNEMSDKLRPGMRGVAKIEVGKKPLIAIWTHGLVSKIRIWLWKTGL